MELKNKGKIKQSVLKRSIIKQIGYSDITAVETAVGCDNLKIAFIKAYNKSLIQGFLVADVKENHIIKPKYVSMGMVVPLLYDEENLREIIKEFSCLSDKYSLLITGGHTEVSEYVSKPVITISIFGDFDKEFNYDMSALNDTELESDNSRLISKSDCLEIKDKSNSCKDKTKYIIQTGYIGICGTYKLYETESEQIKEKLPQSITNKLDKYFDYISIEDVADALYEATKQNPDRDVIYFADSLGTGGIYEGLYDLTESLSMSGYTGFDVDIKKIQIMQETVEVCNILDVNPYMMESSGAALVVTDNPDYFITVLEEMGTVGSIIGTLNHSNDKIVRIDDEIKYIEPFKEDILKK